MLSCSFLKQIPELRTPLFHAQFLHDIDPCVQGEEAERCWAEERGERGPPLAPGSEWTC